MEITSISGLTAGLEGQVIDFTCEGVSGAEVWLGTSAQRELLKATTGADGFFCFSSKAAPPLASAGEWRLTARHQGGEAHTTISTTNLFFKPVHYRPLPEKTASLNSNVVLLDGDWKINPASTNGARLRPLSDSSWAIWQVPGQWLQQGFDIPRDQPAAVAREFVLPREWAGRRLILRFDSIHAGTRYWLNGHELGYRENLFTPVEWDITDAARPGTLNRLDLE
ncbi:MAG: sugar-binding domain-containing protein, partial [Verrucomicrobiota bacterium]